MDPISGEWTLVEYLLFQPICPDGDTWSTTVSVIGVFFSDTTFWRMLQTWLTISYFNGDEGYCTTAFPLS